MTLNTYKVKYKEKYTELKKQLGGNPCIMQQINDCDKMQCMKDDGVSTTYKSGKKYTTIRSYPQCVSKCNTLTKDKCIDGTGCIYKEEKCIINHKWTK